MPRVERRRRWAGLPVAACCAAAFVTPAAAQVATQGGAVPVATAGGASPEAGDTAAPGFGFGEAVGLGAGLGGGLGAASTAGARGPGGVGLGGGASVPSAGGIRALGGAGGLGGGTGPFGTAAPEAGAAGRAFRFAPRLGLEALATDNLFQTDTGREADVVTTISPGLLATADTVRLRGLLNYAPLARLYATNSGENRVDQVLGARAVAALLPGRVFLDLRAAAAPQSTRGGFAPQSGAVRNRADQTQGFNAQIMPYLLQPFGSFATLQLGYAYQYASQSGDTATPRGQPTPFFVSQRFNANTVFAVLRSGEDFGRLAVEGRVLRTEYDGSGVFEDAHQGVASIEARYAVLRGLAVLLQGGYQDLRFAGVTPFEVREPIWSAGVRLTPTPESSVVAKYGYLDGFHAAYLNAGVSLGGRTRLFTTYSDRLGTTLLQAQDLLSTTTVDAFGNAVDANTGGPALASDDFLAAQTSLSRITRLTVAATQTWPRDSFTVALVAERQRPVLAPVDGLALRQRGVSGSVTWLHELTRRAVSGAFVQYGRSTTAGSGDSRVFTVAASLSYRFSETLVGSVQYLLSNRDGDDADSRSLQNAVRFGLGVSL